MGYLYMHGGNWAGEQVVPHDFVSAALTPSQSANRAYGYLWWLNAETPALTAMGEEKEGRLSPVAPPDMYAMRGFGNQFVDVIPSLDMIVVRFGADPMSTFDVGALVNDARFDIHEEILEPVLAAVVD
jgi:CubicO group peptidase (beta-lactamase class C family)